MSQSFPNSPYILNKLFDPAGDQPNAIDRLTEGINKGEKFICNTAQLVEEWPLTKADFLTSPNYLESILFQIDVV